MKESERIFAELEALSKPEKKEVLQHFFKTGKGQYGEGDKFIGVVVPDIRKIAKANISLSFTHIEDVLASPWHEMRLCGLLILTEKSALYRKSANIKKYGEEFCLNELEEIYRFYLSHTKSINNWDLVDLSAPSIVGEYLIDKDRSVLYKLAESPCLWEQRISIVSTFAFIKKGDTLDIFALAEKMLQHSHDLIHKAAGWMLREAGKKNKTRLKDFLDKFASSMPRTMLRYSIEKFEPAERKHYLELK